jgi:nitroreductase
MDVRRARDHALRPPVLLAFVVTTHPRSKIPLREQWLGAGAALGNLLNAAHQLGFGAIMLSGERCFDSQLSLELGIGSGEHLAGFVSIGRIAEAPPAARTVLATQRWSCWLPEAQRDAQRLAKTGERRIDSPDESI